MPKITSVEPQKKNPHRFNIYLDGAFAFGADEDLVVDHRLVPGKQLTTQDVERLLFEAEVGKLIERMYRLWNIRPRSEKEARDYLRNLSFKRKLKGEGEVSSFIIDATVQLMKRKNMINDLEFAKMWVESRRKKKGPRVLKQELFQKGIDKEIVSSVMGQVSNKEEQEVAEKLLDKKIRVWKNLTYSEFKKKAYEFLLRRGFEYEVVNDVVEKIINRDYNIGRESD